MNERESKLINDDGAVRSNYFKPHNYMYKMIETMLPKAMVTAQSELKIKALEYNLLSLFKWLLAVKYRENSLQKFKKNEKMADDFSSKYIEKKPGSIWSKKLSLSKRGCSALNSTAERKDSAALQS